MKKVIIFIFLILCLCGCNNNSNSKNDNNTNYKNIMDTSEYIIIDVRTKEEYDEEHIKDAINIPYDKIGEDIGLDKNKKIFVYCRSGARSKKAYDTLKELGYDVYDLGGMETIDLPKE